MIQSRRERPITMQSKESASNRRRTAKNNQKPTSKIKSHPKKKQPPHRRNQTRTSSKRVNGVKVCKSIAVHSNRREENELDSCGGCGARPRRVRMKTTVKHILFGCDAVEIRSFEVPRERWAFLCTKFSAVCILFATMVVYAQRGKG